VRGRPAGLARRKVAAGRTRLRTAGVTRTIPFLSSDTPCPRASVRECPLAWRLCVPRRAQLGQSGRDGISDQHQDRSTRAQQREPGLKPFRR
jgi:hypothetical protein